MLLKDNQFRRAWIIGNRRITDVRFDHGGIQFGIQEPNDFRDERGDLFAVGTQGFAGKN
jgi:hypothetical protein